MKRVHPFIIPALLVMTCLPGLVSYSQQRQATSKSDQFHAVHWDNEDGLAVKYANAIFKDEQGFLWIGNGGPSSSLYRFDGAVFKRYIPDANKRGAINSGAVHTFEEDSLQNIWMGTEKGLSRYDIKADTFSNFAPLYDSPYAKATIAPFWATKEEIYCIEPGSWITAIDVRTFARRKLVKIPKEADIEVEHSNTNKSFFEVSSGSFWALAQYPGRQGMRLIQIAPNGIVTNFTWPCRRNHTAHGHGHDAEDMEYDVARNSIWINSGDGLLEFSLKDKQFHPIAAMDEFTGRKGFDRGVGIDMDQNNRIWFSTWSDGIFIYDPQTNQVNPLSSNPGLQKKIGENNLHIYVDPHGIAWILNWSGSGIYQLLPVNSVFTRYYAKPTVKDSLSSAMVSSILRGPNGKLWLGTADGINIFDPETDKFEVLRERDLPGIKGRAIIPIYIDSVNQTAWLNAGSQESFDEYFGMSMYEMDLRTKRCRAIIFRDGNKRIDTFINAHTLVKAYRDGIIFCDEKHGVFEVKRGSQVANLLIPFHSPTGYGGIALADNRYLFLQAGGPLPNYTFENKNERWMKIPHLFDSLNWTYMLYDSSDQTYWVCIRNEILHFNKDFQKIRSYNPDNWEMDVITNLLFDNDGNLWFVDYSGQIGRLNPLTGIISRLWETDGFKKQENGWFPPAAKDAAGNIYFGIGWKTGNEEPNWGFDRSHPERFFQVKPSKVYIDALSINQKPFPLSHRVSNVEELFLRYNQNNISVEGGIIDYYSRGKSRLRYKLVENGKEADWQYGPSHFTLHYEGLPPGDYKLVMQASNVNYEFSGPQKILTVTIGSPLWDKAWFRILVVTFAVLLLYGFIQYRSRNLRKRNVQLEEKVLSRTKELKQSLEDLRDTQTQLIQREKMASLGELTAGIAHEIQNPLNFVNNFSEVNREMLEDMKSEIDNGNMEEVKAIAHDLIENEEKINYHGKRADGIVKGMLQHSRTSSGIKEPTDINALTDESLRLSYHGFRAKDNSFHAHLITDFDPGLGKINIIPQDIGRVVLNLCNNAFFAMRERKKREKMEFQPTISVLTRLIPSQLNTRTGRPGELLAPRVEIRIRDNGGGITEKTLAKIFQPFFTTKPTGEGTGLGLSLAYDIVTKMHGGELMVETTEGDTAEFIILLPT